MKIPKQQIGLSENHPSLLLDLKPEKSQFFSPLIVNEDGILVDGYRRYQLQEDPEPDVITLNTKEIFPVAMALNERTRIWDETDCFLWVRWARHHGIESVQLPIQRSHSELFGAEVPLLQLIAQRRLLLRQAEILMNAPRSYRPFLLHLLTEKVRLNVNETRDFVEMISDLANQRKMRDLRALAADPPFSTILADKSLTPKQKGEHLLREIRVLRYPYYQRKLDEFSGNWKELQLEPDFQAKRNLFVERELLEITFSVGSYEEMKEKVNRLYQSLNSFIWSKLWKEK